MFGYKFNNAKYFVFLSKYLALLNLYIFFFVMLSIRRIKYLNRAVKRPLIKRRVFCQCDTKHCIQDTQVRRLNFSRRAREIPPKACVSRVYIYREDQSFLECPFLLRFRSFDSAQINLLKKNFHFFYIENFQKKLCNFFVHLIDIDKIHHWKADKMSCLVFKTQT